MADLTQVYLQPNEQDQTRQNSVTRQLLEVLSNRRYLNIRDFGAIGDGTTDDTAAITKCFKAAAANGSAVFIPYGNYNLNGAIATDGILSIFGRGFNSTIVQKKATGDTFTRTTDTNQILFSDFTISAFGNSGNCINISSDCSAVFNNVYFKNPNTGIFLQKGGNDRVTNCIFDTVGNAGIQMQNIVTPDEGDHSIEGCTFDGPAGGGATGIIWGGAGGMRVVNNKFSGMDYGIIYSPAANNTATGQSEVVGNSFDLQAQVNIDFSNTFTGCTFNHLSIVGNYFASTSICINTETGNSSYWLSNVDVIGNEMNCVGGTAIANLNGTCSDFYFSGNTLSANPVFIISATSSNHVIGENDYSGASAIFDNISNTVTTKIIGLQMGAGAPSFAATRGTIYSNMSATAAATRLYINTSTSTSAATSAWAHFTASS